MVALPAAGTAAYVFFLFTLLVRGSIFACSYTIDQRGSIFN